MHICSAKHYELYFSSVQQRLWWCWNTDVQYREVQWINTSKRKKMALVPALSSLSVPQPLITSLSTTRPSFRSPNPLYSTWPFPSLGRFHSEPRSLLICGNIFSDRTPLTHGYTAEEWMGERKERRGEGEEWDRTRRRRGREGMDRERGANFICLKTCWCHRF